MIHQPSGGAGGQASDISIVANEILRIREKMFDLYADHCQLGGEQRPDTRARFGECREDQNSVDKCHNLSA